MILPTCSQRKSFRRSMSSEAQWSSTLITSVGSSLRVSLFLARSSAARYSLTSRVPDLVLGRPAHGALEQALGVLDALAPQVGHLAPSLVLAIVLQYSRGSGQHRIFYLRKGLAFEPVFLPRVVVARTLVILRLALIVAVYAGHSPVVGLAAPTLSAGHTHHLVAAVAAVDEPGEKERLRLYDSAGRSARPQAFRCLIEHFPGNDRLVRFRDGECRIARRCLCTFDCG